jgi:hypothetical protein
MENVPGTMEVYDPYLDSTWIVFDSCSLAEFTFYIDPGEMRLLRIRQKNWQGEISGTWPAFSTNRVSGDLIINAGNTLTINKNVKIRAKSFADSAGSGTDLNKVEIIVKGDLEAIGASTDSMVVFTSDVDSVNSWYGIRVINSGSADLEYVTISNAYIGYKNTSSDTLTIDDFKDSEISDFYAYGAYLTNDNMEVSRITIKNDTNIVATGLYLGDVDYCVADCDFEDVRYGIRVVQGSPSLSEIEINRCRRGIWISTCFENDTTIVEDSDVHFYSDVGVLIGQDNSLARVSSCQIDYGRPGSFGLLNIYGSSMCAVEHSTFLGTEPHPDSSDVTLIYSNGGSTDVGGGAASSPGRNYFPDPCQSGPPCISAKYYINNIHSIDTTYAKNCCWHDVADPQDTSWFGKINGIVNHQNYNMRCLSQPEKSSIAFDFLPTEFSINQNYPNPFNPVTTIEYSLPQSCEVSIKIYNVLGQVVNCLVEEQQDTGEYNVIWDGTDANGRPVASGMYFYQMVAGDFVSAKKMVVLK